MIDRQPTLTGDLVHLRPMREADYPALYAVASDPEIWSLHPARDRWREDLFRQYFEDGLASGGALVIVDCPKKLVIGSSRYGPYDVERDRIEIGWTYLARDYWGGPHNRDVKRLMLGHMLPSVYAVVFRVAETNLRSRRALEKIGAALTEERSTIEINDREWQHLVYTISRVPA